MFVEALPQGARRNLALLAETGLTASFYLAGGTAAALHLGHRISVDLDFFGLEHFDSAQLAACLSDLGQFRLERLGDDTLLGELGGVRISFFHYPYRLVVKPVSVLGVNVAGIEDIAAMKLDAISRRGTRRDFVDLYFIAQSGLTVSEALQWYQRKYAGLNLDLVHLMIYAVSTNGSFAKDYRLRRDQIQGSAISVMSNIAEGFDAGGDAEFIRFLGYARRSASELQSQLYITLDQDYIDQQQFDGINA